MRDQEAPKVLVLVGTRPELIKLGSSIDALRRSHVLKSMVVFSGQHTFLLDQASSALGIVPDQRLPALPAGRSMTSVLAQIVGHLGDLMAEEQVRAIVVQGDTVTSLAGAITSELMAIPLIHLEAGVRSHIRDDPFPEETIRRMISPITELHLCFSEAGVRNLVMEGHSPEAIRLVPHPLKDRVGTISDQYKQSESRILLITLHRRERREDRALKLLEVIGRASGESQPIPIHFVWHPGLEGQFDLRAKLDSLGVTVHEPLDPTEFLDLLVRAAIVITDSAGVSEEAQLLGKPLIAFRASAESRLDELPTAPYCATESPEVAHEFLSRHARTDSGRVATLSAVSSGSVIVSHIEDFLSRSTNVGH